MLGDRSVKSLSIDEAALEPDNKEMLEEAITMALNECLAAIEKENDEIEERVTGKNGLF